MQHPQEQDLLLGTARLTEQCLTQGSVRCGLSWRSLGHVLGEAVNARQWAVVYPKYLPRPLTQMEERASQVLMGPQGESFHAPALVGLLLLDGTWSQTKTLWWRNPWLLKLSRLLIHPMEPSLYGRLRREPQRHCVSTLEATADALHGCGENKQIRHEMRRTMRRFLQRLRDIPQGGETAPPSKCLT